MTRSRISSDRLFQRPFSRPISHLLLALTVGALALPLSARAADTELLNVSYDVARELYKDVNPAFSADYKQKTGETVVVKQSHGGSS